MLRWFRRLRLRSRRRTMATPDSPNASPTQLLGKADIACLIADRHLLVEPMLDIDSQLDQMGLDLRLDCFFREFVRTDRGSISPGDEAHGTTLREIEPFRDSFFLQPGEFALAQSLEYIALPNDVLCFLNGRSSLGRRGLVACNIENDSEVCYQSACLEQLSDCRDPKLRNCARECARGRCAPETCAARG